jgi:hypothetical protein
LPIKIRYFVSFISKSQNQIILKWIISRGYLPLTKSETIQHIDDYLDLNNFIIEKSDLDRLNSFHPPNYQKPKAFWGAAGKGVRIDQLCNVFDEDYEKQMVNHKSI